MREILAIHVELQQLPSFWAGDQAHVASTGLSFPKLGQLIFLLAADLAVRNYDHLENGGGGCQLGEWRASGKGLKQV